MLRSVYGEALRLESGSKIDEVPRDGADQLITLVYHLQYIYGVVGGGALVLRVRA